LVLHVIVAAIDAKKKGIDGWEVYTHGGRIPTGLDALKWAQYLEELGAGELLVTSMDRDGTKEGYDLELIKKYLKMLLYQLLHRGCWNNGAHL